MIGAFFIRDDTPSRRWIIAVGERKWIDDVFDWFENTFGPSGSGWFSMMWSNGDATSLEIHIQDEAHWPVFDQEYGEDIMSNEFESDVE